MKYRIVTRNGLFRPQQKTGWYVGWDFILRVVVDNAGCYDQTKVIKVVEFTTAIEAKAYIDEKQREDLPWLIVPPTQIPVSPEQRAQATYNCEQAYQQGREQGRIDRDKWWEKLLSDRDWAKKLASAADDLESSAEPFDRACRTVRELLGRA